MDKTRRNFTLFIGITDTHNTVVETIEIGLPFTVEFDINRNTLSSVNTGIIRLYNLNETTRKKIFKDSFRYDIYKPVQLKAGYQNETPTIFKGNIRQAYSVRQGVDWITTIEAYDGGDAFVNTVTNETFPKQTRTNEILQGVLTAMKDNHVDVGVIGAYDEPLARANTLSGNSADIAKALSGDGFFIDLEKAYCLQDEECIRGSLLELNSAAGLLGTPVRTETYLDFDIIFEPRLLVGQLIKLTSVTEKNFNGFYKVIGIKHTGTISDAICGDAVTSVRLWYGTKSLTMVN